MFVIYTKFSQQHNYIFLLVESIRQFHPDDKIAIFDSNSGDTSYLQHLQMEYTNIDCFYGNSNYGDSAVWKAFKAYPDEDYFFLLQDSMLVKQNLDFMKVYDFYSYMYFDYPEKYDSEEQREYCKSQIAKTKFEWIDNYLGLFGITFGIKKEVLQDLYDGGLSMCLPSNKLESQGSERIWGIALKSVGIEIDRHSICEDYFQPSEEGKAIIEKRFVGRQ